MRAGKNLLAILAGIALLAGIEGSLAHLGYTPLSATDRFAGFRPEVPTFVRAEDGGGGARYRLNPAKARFFNEQSFLAPPPPGTFRIVAFGGSTTYGRPYIARTAFPAWMRGILSVLDPSRPYEAINMGGISYASHRISALVAEAGAYSPSLYVLYSGHNEFLEAVTYKDLLRENPAVRRVRALLHRSRLYSALFRGIETLRARHRKTRASPEESGFRVRLEEVGGPELYHRDPQERERVIERFRAHVRTIVETAKGQGVPLVLCTVPSNLSGVSPFKSEHRPGLSDEELRGWQERFRRGRAELARGDARAALDALDEAARIDDRYALLHYLRGRALLALGRSREAYEAFNRAKEEDIVPLRALDAFNEIVREIAADAGLPLADVERKFREVTPNGIPGPELFVDHVHPTIKGQQLIAWTVLDAAVRAGLVPVDRDTWEASQERVLEYLAREYEGIPARYRALGLWGVGRLYHWAGKYEEAYGPLLRAWQTVKDIEEIPRLLGDLELARSRPDRALAFFREAERLAPDQPETQLGLAKAYLALGQPDRTDQTLDRIPEGRRDSPVYRLLRGEAALDRGDPQGALAWIEPAAREAPGVQRFAFSLARVYAALGRDGEAREAFRRFLRLAGEPWSEAAYKDFVAGRWRPSVP